MAATLRETIEWIEQNYRGGMTTTQGTDEDRIKMYGPYKVISMSTGGESRWEHFISHLEDSAFGFSYKHAVYRGGGYEFYVPEEDMNTTDDWLGMIIPRQDLLEGFYNLPGYEVEIVPTYTLRYVKNEKEKIIQQLHSAIDAIIANNGGMEKVHEILGEEGINTFRFRGNSSGDRIDLSLKYEESTNR